jgi:hypothetical protein
METLDYIVIALCAVYIIRKECCFPIDNAENLTGNDGCEEATKKFDWINALLLISAFAIVSYRLMS